MRSRKKLALQIAACCWINGNVNFQIDPIYELQTHKKKIHFFSAGRQFLAKSVTHLQNFAVKTAWCQIEIEPEINNWLKSINHNLLNNAPVGNHHQTIMIHRACVFSIPIHSQLSPARPAPDSTLDVVYAINTMDIDVARLFAYVLTLSHVQCTHTRSHSHFLLLLCVAFFFKENSIL